MPYDLIIFDCDGTLVDSEYLNNFSLVTLFQSFGLTYDIDHALEHWVGLRLSSIMQMVKLDQGFIFPENTPALFNAKVKSLASTHLKKIEHVVHTVETAQNHADICVVSNGERNSVLASLNHAGLSHFFDKEFIFTGLMAENPKPAPDLFLLAAEKKGIDPSRILVIEDSLAGVTAAVAAGMDVWGFYGCHHAPHMYAPKLRQAGAREVFTEMRDVERRFNQIFKPPLSL